MTIKYTDIPNIRLREDIKSQLIVILVDKGGLLTAHELIREAQNRNILPESYDRAKSLLYHHVRESYYMSREKGDIIRLIPIGKDDSRLWSNPLDCPDITSFIFSLLVREREADMNYSAAIPWIREYIETYEREHHVDCPGKGILTSVNGGNTYYTIKKQVKYYLESKDLL
jgi:hypothetical protein